MEALVEAMATSISSRRLRSGPSFLCVTETESRATVCLSPHGAPQVAVTYTRSTSVAPNTNMKNVVFGAFGRGIVYIRVGKVRGG